MTILEAYINERNAFQKLFKHSLFSKGRMTGDEAAALYQHIDADLSPEILTADGERSVASVRARAAFLRNAVRELDGLGFHRPDSAYHLPEQRSA